jgi:Tol biopolymer transport system component
LEPLTTYHLRLSVTNAAGTTYGPDTTLRTLAAGDSGGVEECDNALARKQTGAGGLPDCRAYELVSAAYTGGYDVEAPMVPDQEPFAGFPSAAGFEEDPSTDSKNVQKRLNRVLYGVHAGVIPGPWKPTNRGVDPYVAVRNAPNEQWETEYVGLSADQSPAKTTFSSELGGTSGDLKTFAFAGEDLCFPCFEIGFDTGVPLHDPAGQLVQGLGEPGDVPETARPEGRVAKMVSADGTSLVFGSKYDFAAGDGNDDTGDLTIYVRDLASGEIEVASTDASGNALEEGDEVAELDVSSDGSRVLIGADESEDAAGNEYVHLFLHRAGTAASSELAPAATSGVLFAGMSADGSKVFFTSSQKLDGSDTDTAADLYQAAVAVNGTVTLSLLTPAAGGSCNPVSNEAGAHWNTVGATADCSAVAIGGGDGVSASGGPVYFLSREQLDGAYGTAILPILYSVESGEAPQFVATLSPNDPVVLDSVHDASAPEISQFQTPSTGDRATFRSTALITGVNNGGAASVFLYEDGGATPIVCVSCNPSLTEDTTLKGEANLARDGLSITDDGRVFFSTTAALSVEDNNGKRDVYEWVNNRARLISAGDGPFDTEFLSTTPNGTDAFFFTHDTLDSNVDKNGERTKIYDARSGGGFFKLPVKPQCAASDECHGPGTVAPAKPQIGSSGKTSDGNVRPCPKGSVRQYAKNGKPGKCKKKNKKNKKNKKGKSKKGKKRNG